MAHVRSHSTRQPASPASNDAQRRQASDRRNADDVQRLKAQCSALQNDPAEQDVLAWTEAAAHDIKGWR
ncbi:antitoxin MazE-like protein [Castellaniella hirudinis]|uniref:Antitoxin MazE-like protein n=1 Tax=Castellaniella hirudinis TaxID=1144617 RepID=A0ABV8RWL0_9BURK